MDFTHIHLQMFPTSSIAKYQSHATILRILYKKICYSFYQVLFKGALVNCAKFSVVRKEELAGKTI